MSLETTIKRSFFDNSNRELIINSEYIKFEDKDHKNNSFSIFKKEEITDYRYGIRWINGFKFIIGREYQIFIKNNNNDIIKINFSTYYGRKINEYHKKYVKITEHLWDNFFKDIAISYIEKLKNGESFTIGKIEFSNEGILFSNGILKKSISKIDWQDLETKNYQTYFAIFSKNNPANINCCLYYKDDWNTAIIYSIIRTYLKEKGKK